MTGEIRWGILGTGWIAGEQTNDLLKNGFTVTAVGSRTIESAAAFASRFGIPNPHGSYEELVADPNVDIVYVATPHPMHHHDALLALNAGKHVLLEKPLTLNAAEARELVDLAHEKHLVLLEAMWTRFLPHMIRIREIIASGMIGQVRTVIADHTQFLPKDPEHRINNPDLGGGALLDLGIYPISLAWDVFGKPETIHANSTKTATGVDRQTAIILTYSDGQQALLLCALDTAGPNTATIIGTEGWIDIEGVFYTPTTFTVYDSQQKQIEHFEQQVSQRGMQFQAWEAERRIRDGLTDASVLPPSESVQIMETLDEVRRQIGLVYPGGK
jgi:predicted dehydrogenase